MLQNQKPQQSRHHSKAVQQIPQGRRSPPDRIKRKNGKTNADNGKRKLVNGLLIAYIVLMGLSRIYVGVHWPSDVFGSWILGLAVIEIMQAIFL